MHYVLLMVIQYVELCYDSEPKYLYMRIIFKKVKHTEKLRNTVMPHTSKRWGFILLMNKN